MSKQAMQPPDLKLIDQGLKDFQRKTVRKVFDTLYKRQSGSRRFLVADEVGLGKTMVARGVIAKAIHEMWETVDRIDIIYICSNADIARQNIKRLNVMDDMNVVKATRITLLPIRIHELRDNKVNFIALTPGTSLDLKSNLGIRKERALLYCLLRPLWKLHSAPEKNVFQGNCDTKNFRHMLTWFEDYNPIDKRLAREFRKAVKQRSRDAREQGEPGLKRRFSALCDIYCRSDVEPDWPERHKRSQFIGELRTILAEVCLDALEPDIVILDEFQRFKPLLEGEGEAGFLATRLFNWSDGDTAVRSLLLSATPYKMYALAEEDADGDHYQDFIGTLRFLFDDQRKTDEFAALLKDFRLELLRSHTTSFARLEELKHKIEQRLRKVMVRTEKLATSTDRGGMLLEKPAGVHLQARDVLAYRELQQVSRLLDMPDTVEYWKSSSYLLNLMEDYKLKHQLNAALDDPAKNKQLATVLKDSANLLLHWQDIENYEQLDPRNARLRGLVEQTVEQDWWKLLWLPPSLPYYPLEGPWAEVVANSGPPTKRLVFSSWRIVPKVIASVLSYEAERRTVQLEDPAADNSHAERERRTASQLLRIATQDGRETGMPVLALCYPSLTLARRYDPLVMTREFREQHGRAPKLAELYALIETDIKERLGKLSYRKDKEEGRKDERWYWAAPLLLDRYNYSGTTKRWFEQEELAEWWSGEDGKSWSLHVERARQMVLGEEGLGPMPDDLAAVMTELALGGPATIALRALSRVHATDDFKSEHLRNAAAHIGWSFRALFNRFDAVALIRGLKLREPYWRGVLDYCATGNLQAVMDEYVHVLKDALGLTHAELEDSAWELAEAVSEALGIMPATLAVDDLTVNGNKVTKQTNRLPTRFALAFGQGKEEGTGMSDASRSHKVREAFNSPFWPFVVASTSIGQEGLDFHLYCHAVVHWNLPGNPVDLEQREGRVHRFKGHAVRKNLAQVHGEQVLSNYTRDPLHELFHLGRMNRAQEDNDLVPFWIYPLEDGAHIERHVPALPLTRDRQLLEALRRSLVVYRMVFGQPRQEDLVNYLLRHVAEEDMAEMVARLRIDLGP
jgi:hypothetical protein